MREVQVLHIYESMGEPELQRRLDYWYSERWRLVALTTKFPGPASTKYEHIVVLERDY